MALDSVDGAEATAEVFEFAYRAFEVDGVADRQRIHGFGHTAAFGVGGVKVYLHQHVQEALFGGVGNGRVGSDDGVAGDGVAQADHEVLADGQAEGLGGMLEGKGEDAGVGGDDAFGVEKSFCPGAGVEEGWARGVAFGGRVQVAF